MPRLPMNTFVLVQEIANTIYLLQIFSANDIFLLFDRHIERGQKHGLRLVHINWNPYLSKTTDTWVPPLINYPQNVSPTVLPLFEDEAFNIFTINFKLKLLLVIIWIYHLFLKMLTDTLRTLVYELFLKIFYKNNNKVNNFFNIFFITHKSSIKTFLIYIYSSQKSKRILV